MKVLVIGSTGGTGRAAVAHLLAAGHEVTAFARNPERLDARPRLAMHAGDATSYADVEAAVRGHDAVVVTLGITENPLRVRLRGPAHTPIDVRSTGTRNAIAAMRAHGVKRLVVLTSYGVGDTRARLGFADRLVFSLLLKPQIADTEVQTDAVQASGLDWVLVQPVHLTDDPADDMPFASTTGDTATMKITRASVGRYLAHAVADAALVRQAVSLSAR